MVRQISLTREERERIASGRTVYLFDDSQKCVGVLLGDLDLDGVSASEIDVQESRARRAAWDAAIKGDR